MLKFSERTGEYFFERRIQPPDDRRLRGQMHADAADAIVDLFHGDDEIGRFNFRQALTPAWPHEAEWHLEQARWLFANRSGEKVRVMQQHERLSRVGEIFGWTRVRWAAKQSAEDGDDILAVLMAHLDDVQKCEAQSRTGAVWLHPIELFWSAMFVASLAQRIRNDPKKEEKYKEYVRLKDELFEMAVQRCTKFDRDRSDRASLEGDSCRYMIVTSRACLALFGAPSRFDLAKRFFKEALSLEKRSAAVTRYVDDMRWFEYLGDYEQSHLSSIAAYRKGIINDAAGISVTGEEGYRLPLLYTIVKYLGASRLAGINVYEPIVKYLQQLQMESIDRAVRARLTSGLSVPQAHQRWMAGQLELEQIIGGRQGG